MQVTSSTSPLASVSTQSSANVRAADGDYKTKGAGHEVKDADGDYKPTQVAAPTSAAASSSSGVQSALTTLTKGG